MLEMLKARKEALQERGVKGFTLMEMLIVIAIIAVLVAIAIPILGAQLERANEATDAANIRSAYAEVTASYLGDNKAHSETVDLKSNTTDWQSDDEMEIAGVSAKDLIGKDTTAKTTVEVAVDATGKVTIGGVEVTSKLDKTAAGA